MYRSQVTRQRGKEREKIKTSYGGGGGGGTRGTPRSWRWAVYSKLILGIFSRFWLFVLPLLPTANETGDGGGAGGSSSSKVWCSFAGLGLEAVIMAREISSEKEARASTVVRGPTGRGVTVLVETEAIMFWKSGGR